MKNAVFWDVAQCGSCKNRRFGGTCRLRLRGRKIRERRKALAAGYQTEPQFEKTLNFACSISTLIVR
jgi:hypothetical protein